MTRYFDLTADSEVDVTGALKAASVAPGENVEVLLQVVGDTNSAKTRARWELRPADAADVPLGPGHPLAEDAAPVRLFWRLATDPHLVVSPARGQRATIAVTVLR